MKKFAALFALLLAAIALAACGSDSDTEETAPSKGVQETEEAGGAAGGGGGAGELQFEADPNGALAYTTDSATSKAGKVTIHFTNESSVPHDVEIEDESGEDVAKTDIISESEDSTTANLKAGEYTFYCTVPGHRDAGMEGTLTVE